MTGHLARLRDWLTGLREWLLANRPQVLKALAGFCAEAAVLIFVFGFIEQLLLARADPAPRGAAGRYLWAVVLTVTFFALGLWTHYLSEQSPTVLIEENWE